MKLARLALISIILLFLLATLIATLLPSTVLVSRAVNINGRKDSLMAYIKDIYHWRYWIEGMQDPSVKIYSGSRADLGTTQVTITGITDSTVISVWQGTSSNPQTATVRIIADSARPVSVVQWQFVQKLKWYPWEKFGSMMNDKIMGTMMEKNLNNLRLLVERH